MRKADSSARLIGSEADLPHHLANEKAATSPADDDTASNVNLATSDYALSQA